MKKIIAGIMTSTPIAGRFNAMPEDRRRQFVEHARNNLRPMWTFRSERALHEKVTTDGLL
jgi:hypothetical protein